MDDATQLKLDAALHLLVYPGLTLLTVAAAGLAARRNAESQERPGVLALALAAALTVSFVGIVAVPAIPPVDTRDFTPFFTALLPLPFLLIESRSRLGVIAPLAALALVTLLGLYLRPILGGEFAPHDRVAFTAAVMLATWLGVDRLATALPAPTVLAAICFAAIGAAVAAMLSGTAVIGQALGGVAAVTGMASIMAWRLPRLAMGRAAVAAALIPFFGGLAYAQYYGDLPAVPATLCALAPLLAVVALPLRSVVLATVAAGLAAFVPAAAGAGYAKVLSDARNAPPDGAEGTPAAPDYSIIK